MAVQSSADQTGLKLRALFFPLVWIPILALGRCVGYWWTNPAIAILLVGYVVAVIAPAGLAWAVWRKRAALRHYVRTSWYVRAVLLFASLSAVVGFFVGMGGCSGHPMVVLPR